MFNERPLCPLGASAIHNVAVAGNQQRGTRAIGETGPREACARRQLIGGDRGDFDGIDGNVHNHNQHLHASLNTWILKANQNYQTLTSIDKLDLNGAMVHGVPDPRSDRFPTSRYEYNDTRLSNLAACNSLGQTRSTRWDASSGVSSLFAMDFNSSASPGWTLKPAMGTGQVWAAFGMLGTNQDTSAWTSGTTAYYTDPDGVPCKAAH